MIIQIIEWSQLPIHSIVWRSNTFCMFDKDAGIILSGSIASLEPLNNGGLIVVTSGDPRFPADFLILDYNVHSQQSDDGSICPFTTWDCQTPFICLTWRCGNHSERVYSLNHWIMVPVYLVVTQDFQLTSSIKFAISTWRITDDGGSICPSTAYGDCQTPFICLTRMWEPFWVGYSFRSTIE